jgi:hypothetical protein
LEKASPEMAQKLCVKANVLKPIDFEKEHNNGVDINVAMIKGLVYDRISAKPPKDTPEARKQYVYAIDQLQRVLEPIKTQEDLNGAISSLKDRMNLELPEHLQSMERQFDYAKKEYEREPAEHDLMERYYNGGDVQRIPITREQWKAKKKKRMDEITEKIKQWHENAKNPYSVLGEKLTGFFTNYEKRNRTIDTVRKKKLSWDQYMNSAPKEKPKRGEQTKAEKRLWLERAEVDQGRRENGRDTKVQKPEDAVKTFGFRGVEFGNWVDDESGKFHLKRASEAFHDLADFLGITDKDISLNGRLAMAFGARGVGGKGAAKAHYEPGLKVINITKMGGAGSLCHEWGHALDNIMYQYSHGGAGSLHHASEGEMGNEGSTEIKAAYEELMNVINNGDGTSKATIQVLNKKRDFYRYYPARKNMVTQNDKITPEMVKEHEDKIDQKINREVESYKRMLSIYPSNKERYEKKIKSLETKRKREKNELYQEIMYHQFRKTGEHPTHLEVYTGESEYLTRMHMQDGGTGNYWSKPCEMFARVFESYIEDQLGKQGKYNGYLVHGTSEKYVKALGTAYPIGNERKLMHQAMGKLLKAIVASGAIKKAIDMEILKSLENHNRNAYNVANASEVFYIPINRLQLVYQTEKATNWDKVKENIERMQNGENIDPVVIGYDYDVHDGHHKLEASKAMNYTHVPCIVGGSNPLDVQRAKEAYGEVWKALIIYGLDLPKVKELTPMFKALNVKYNPFDRYFEIGVEPNSEVHKKLQNLAKSYELLLIDKLKCGGTEPEKFAKILVE